MKRILGMWSRGKMTVLAVMVALVLVAAPVAFAANGKPFILGKKNTATKVSSLVKKGAGPALKLVVKSGAPLAVNSAVKVANLNADRLDGLDSTAFLGVNGKAADADRLDGKDSSEFFSAVKSRSASVVVPDNSSGSVKVECQAGERMIGGGAALSLFVSDVALISSRPSVSGGGDPSNGGPFNEWRATAVNPTGGTGDIGLRVFAVCAT